MNIKCTVLGHTWKPKWKVVKVFKDRNDDYPPTLTMEHRVCCRCGKVQYWAPLFGPFGAWRRGEVEDGSIVNQF